MKHAYLISFDTDWLFPTAEVARIEAAMREAGVDVAHLDIPTPNGHDAFLIDYHLINPPVQELLASL